MWSCCDLDLWLFDLKIYSVHHSQLDISRKFDELVCKTLCSQTFRIWSHMDACMDSLKTECLQQLIIVGGITKTLSLLWNGSLTIQCTMPISGRSEELSTYNGTNDSCNEHDECADDNSNNETVLSRAAGPTACRCTTRLWCCSHSQQQ